MRRRLVYVLHDLVRHLLHLNLGVLAPDYGRLALDDILPRTMRRRQSLLVVKGTGVCAGDLGVQVVARG